MMDWGFVSKACDKWASISVGSSGLESMFCGMFLMLMSKRVFLLIVEVLNFVGQPLKAAFLINYEPSGPSCLLPIIAEQAGHKVTPLDLSQFVDFVKHKQFQSDTFYIAGNECMRAQLTQHPAVDQFAWQVGRRNL
ncbi:hypothetical protein QQ045_015343 [Rhodiola kirilowii]